MRKQTELTEITDLIYMFSYSDGLPDRFISLVASCLTSFTDSNLPLSPHLLLSSHLSSPASYPLSFSLRLSLRHSPPLLILTSPFSLTLPSSHLFISSRFPLSLPSLIFHYFPLFFIASYLVPSLTPCARQPCPVLVMGRRSMEADERKAGLPLREMATQEHQKKD